MMPDVFFFVVLHQFEELGIVIAGDGGCAVSLPDEACCLAQTVNGERCLAYAKIKLAHQSERHGIVRGASVCPAPWRTTRWRDRWYVRD